MKISSSLYSQLVVHFKCRQPGAHLIASRFYRSTLATVSETSGKLQGIMMVIPVLIVIYLSVDIGKSAQSKILPAARTLNNKSGDRPLGHDKGAGQKREDKSANSSNGHMRAS